MVSVQVIVPCYNYGRYLPVCVGSILTQTGVDVRVLIINDASSDDSGEVADALARSDPRIRVIHHATNKGHIRTYNEGLDATTADYVVLLSADDLLTPGALHRATQLMEAHPSVGLVYGHPRTVYGDAVPQPRAGEPSWTVWSGAQWLSLMCRSGRNFICCPEVVMRTSVQHRIGGYNPALPHSGDMEMWMRAARVCDIGRVNAVDQAYYRVHASSMQRTIHAGALFDLKGRLAAYESALGADPSLQQARHSLAVIALRYALQSVQCREPLDANIEDYLDFAQTLFPDITRTPLWNRLQRSRSVPPGVVSVALARARWRVRKSLEYRYWRWRGVEWPLVPRRYQGEKPSLASTASSGRGSTSGGVSRTNA